MRIAIVVNCLKIGGMERVAVNLADAFCDAGHYTDLIYLKNRKKEIEPRNSKVSVHLFNLKKAVLLSGIGLIWLIICKVLNVVFKKTFPLWFAYAEAHFFRNKLEKLERKNGQPFDLIIFRGQGTFEQLWPLHDDRFVYVCENVQKKNMYGHLSSWIFNRLFQNRNVICVSQGALTSFQDLISTHHISPKKAITLNNPNNFLHIHDEANQCKKVLHDKPYILGLGRLVPQKNFTLLIQAYHQLIKKHHIQHDLVIVGAGPDQKNIEQEIKKLKLEDKVHLKGQKTQPFPWYQQADLYVLSSKHEGLGMVLIEALACGTKVVSTDSKGGVRQIMKVYLEPFLAKETSDSLAEKMHLALNTPWDDAFSKNVEVTLREFDGKSIVKEYINEFIQP